MTTLEVSEVSGSRDSQIMGLSLMNIFLAVAALSIPPTLTTFVGDILGGGIASIVTAIGLGLASYFTAKLFKNRHFVPERREFVVVAIFYVATGILGLLQLSGLLSAINGNPGLMEDMGGNPISLSISNYLNPFLPAVFCFISWYRAPSKAER